MTTILFGSNMDLRPLPKDEDDKKNESEDGSEDESEGSEENSEDGSEEDSEDESEGSEDGSEEDSEDESEGSEENSEGSEENSEGSEENSEGSEDREGSEDQGSEDDGSEDESEDGSEDESEDGSEDESEDESEDGSEDESEDGSEDESEDREGSEGQGSEDDGSEDDGSKDDGSEDDGSEDDGSEDDGSEDDGSEDDGSEDDGSEDDGSEDDGSEDDGSEDDGSEDDGSDGDEGSEDDGFEGEPDDDESDDDESDDDEFEDTSEEPKIGDSEGEQDSDRDSSAMGDAIAQDYDPVKAMEDLLKGLSLSLSFLRDSNSALGEALKGSQQDILKDEKAWRPLTEDYDQIIKPVGNSAAAEILRQAGQPLTAAIKVAFRRKYLQARDPKIVHGVRRGRDLSEERLVDTMIEIKSRVPPSRPDYRIDPASETTIAVAIVGDESGSMDGDPAKAAAISMIAFAEAFDGLGCPVMCCGPRDGDLNLSSLKDIGDQTQYHRVTNKVIDLFKDWDESFAVAKPRFAAYRAKDGTPLEDGIQYALRALQERTERYRVVLVLTDGEPNNPDVVRRQIRLAQESGVFVVGVGIGELPKLKALFPLSVVVKDLNNLPMMLMSVMDQIVFPKKAQTMGLDGGQKRRLRR